MRATLVSVPGLSLPYQLRISRTRSFIPVPPCRDLCRVVGLAAPASSAPAIRAAAVLPLDPRGVSYPLELGLGYPAQQLRVELRLAMHTVSPLLAPLVEDHPDEHLPLAA